MNAFHAYDIRGIYNEDFTKEDVYRIGYFIPGLLNTKKVLIGRDVRISSPEIFDHLCEGITDSGADVCNIGLSTTPMVYWATGKYNYAASVMITASHNPKEYNGLKISGRDVIPVGYDNGLKEIESKIQNNDPILKSQNKGIVTDFSVKDEYRRFLKKFLTDFSNVKIALDCSNGMAGLLIRDLINNGASYLNEIPDGNFPNHEPNPLNPENIVQLQQLVKKEKSDIGIIFDGDADRVMFVDENANFVSPDLIIAVLSHFFIEEQGITGNVLQDIRTSKSVSEYIEKYGFKTQTWRVGRAYAATKLKEINGLFGGELAGHYYFRDFYYSDSGILACLLVLNILSKFKRKQISFSELIGRISRYANSGEINFKIENKIEAMNSVKDYFLQTEKHTAYYDFDGYRIEFDDWWFNIRPSNTEPYLRLLVEAKNTQTLDIKVNTISGIINKFA